MKPNEMPARKFIIVIIGNQRYQTIPGRVVNFVQDYME